ncbi:S8 family serine peptidase [Solirubrobacter sp. CPCC 204708]|uniref:S8 family serine peptidase n=1 Tax=Solirubrobacter deserti TaxID=2282478 RepID=A0ABT4RCP0_9ACTN|nr:S8 family serine peptidase [Solirubrobacter deserti]MBE2315655.1 S8 family serine peptidase [Solirubrobacter deserti]MDA0136295.1 S8 family serine peptidase [Solirubrobacter deserti]
MVIRLRLSVALLALVAACAPAATAQAAVPPQQVEALDRQGATEIVVRREPGLTAAERADVRADAGVELERRSTLPDTELVRAERGDLAEAVAELNRDPDVVFAEPVTVQTAQTADPYFGYLWGLENTGQKMYVPNGGGSYYPAGYPDADMDVPEAWTRATGAGVSVGIVDTGVLTTHPDLLAQLATNAGETGTDGSNRDKRSNGVDDDGNGYVDDWQGWDFVREYPQIGVSEGDSTPGADNVPQDNHGHGTHVAGTVAAQADNNEGIAGVAPGAKIVPLRALGASGRGSSLNIAEAFDYAGKLGVRIVNASLGGPGLDQSQLAAIQAHPNTLYVIAAGNDNTNVDATPYGPCALPADNILCVGASDEYDRKASFSNYGNAKVDVFAPGTAILSTYVGPAYAYQQGTSMASPNTAGVAALVLSARPGLSALDVKSAIMGSVDAKPELAGKALTGGRVNADRAVSGALGGRPVNVSPPIITGTPRQGATLSTSPGMWNPAGSTYTYLWQRSLDNGASWTTIPDAAASTYVPGVADINALVRVTVVATNPFGADSATSAPVGPIGSGAPVNTVRPAIAGTPRRGQTLTINQTWNPTGTTYNYQWERSADGVTWDPIGADTASFTLTSAERELLIRVTVKATNPYGQATVTSDPVGPVTWDPPVNNVVPSISGSSLQRSSTLSANPGTWSGAGNGVRYQWQSSPDGTTWTAIGGATASTYQLAKADEGLFVRVLVTMTNPDGTADRASAATTAIVAPFPPANVSKPTINGTPQRGRAMTATRGTWTGPDNVYAFQWQRDFGEGWVAIDGATGGSYTLKAEDVDALVRVLVTASNPDGVIVEASDPTPPVLAAGPLNQTPPALTGTAQRGLTLTGTTGTWSGTGNGYSYQWQSSADGTTWTDVPNAKATTYTLVTGDVGRFLRLQVTATNADGTLRATTPASARVIAAPPVNTVAPSLTGTVQRNGALLANRGTWSGNGNVYAYQWQRDGVDIADATGAGYTLTVDDVGKRVRVVVTATNPDATATEVSAASVPVPSSRPANTAPPTISGTARRGSTLTGAAGSWEGIDNSVKFQWQSSPDGTTWTNIAGATGSTRVLATSDVDKFVRLSVTVTNAEGSATAVSAATAKVLLSPPVNTVRPVVSGSAQRGQTLVGTLGTWTGADTAYDYQWQRSTDGTTWTNISGATRLTYELAAGDVGAAVRLRVTGTNPDGTAAAMSTPTATVPAAPPVNTSAPTISGTAKRGSILQGTSGTWSGIGNGWTYQWQRSTDNGTTWSSIEGATRTTYTLVAADVGAIVRLRVTAANAEGTENAVSLPTAAVTGEGPLNTVAPVINGAARRGSTLTALAGTWSGANNAYAYQWQRSADGTTWTNIQGANGSTYELLRADVGVAIRVLVTASNPDGSNARASAATAVIEATPPANAGIPNVTGAALRATTLVGTRGTWTGPDNMYVYQWQRDSGSGYTDIVGALGLTYKLTVADVGARVRLRVTATNPDGSVSAFSLGTATVQGSPPQATQDPEISGTARRASRLSSRLGEWLGIENSYAYQWQRRVSGTFQDIPGATATVYDLAAADVGTEVRLKVTATNADGSAFAVSQPTSTVAVAPPVNLAPPTLSGPPRLGGNLSVRRGDWAPEAEYAYQWQRNGNDIPGATGISYLLVADDVGAVVRVKVTASNEDGRTTAVSAPTATIGAPPVNLVAPGAPSGTPRQSATLTAEPGTWDQQNVTFTYSWFRCTAAHGTIVTGCEPVGVGTEYLLSAQDIGMRIGVRVRAATTGGEATIDSALTVPIAMHALSNTTRPAIGGDGYPGETLLGDPGRWTFPNVDLTFDWRRCDADGVTGCLSVGDGTPRFPVTGADEAHTIVLVITATFAGQTATAQSVPLAIRPRPVPVSVAPPVVTGLAKRGQVLTATTGTWSNTPSRFAYQWLRCLNGDCQPISGAMLDSYRVTKADEGHTLAVLVTATNSWGSGSERSAETGAAVAGPPVNTHVPVIQSSSPIIQQGVTLTMTSYTWVATDDTNYSFSWERCDANGCAAIPGATGDRYTLVAGDVDFKIVGVSTAANEDGTVTARSAETDVVSIAGPRWKTLPLLSTSAGRVGDTLTITPGVWTGPALSSNTVELMRCTNVCVARAADVPTYKIVDADIGAILRVRESASNAGGSTVVWSARYVGPVVGAQGASAVLSSREAPLRNARGETLAFARLSGGTAKASAAAAKPKGGRKVALRRPAKTKGKLVAWACPAAIEGATTPPPCSKRVTLKKKATLALPAGTDGKVRVVVIRSR